MVTLDLACQGSIHFQARRHHKNKVACGLVTVSILHPDRAGVKKANVYHILKLEASLCLGRLHIAPCKGQTQDDGRHQPTSWPSSVC